METTSGLVSPYQLVDHSAQIVVRHNLATTDATEFAVEVITLPDAIKLRDMEWIKVKVPSRYEHLAISLLSKRIPLEVLTGSILVLMRRALRILEEAGVPYEAIE